MLLLVFLQRGMAMATLMQNKYWVLRHGRSLPNELGLIVSHMSNGVLPNHGLSPAGMEQAREAGKNFLKEIAEERFGISNVRVYCSPFSRTMDTAKAVADVMEIDASKFQYCEDLRERYFGPALELNSHEHYPKVWALDESNPLVGPDGGESVEEVAARMYKVIRQIEMECQGAAVLIVSHGDPLQILQAIVGEKGIDGVTRPWNGESFDARVLSQHRKFTLLTGELRRII